MREHIAQDRIGANPFGLALEGEDQAVAESGPGDAPDVLEGGVEPAVQERIDLPRQGQRLCPSGTRAIPNKPPDLLERTEVIRVCRENQAGDVLFDGRGQMCA